MDGLIVLIDTFPLSDVWGSPAGFVTVFIMAIGMMAMAARSLTLAATAAYVTFVYFAVETGLAVLQPILYATLTLVAIGTAMKLWRMEGLGT